MPKWILAALLMLTGCSNGSPHTAYVPPPIPKERVAAKEQQMSNGVDGWQLFAHGNLKNTVEIRHVLVSDTRKLLTVSADQYSRTLVGDSLEGDWR